MSIKTRAAEIAAKIRTAVYGAEVREYIARGAELCGDTVDEAAKQASAAKSSADAAKQAKNDLLAVVDATLSKSGAPADAAEAGKRIDKNADALSAVSSQLSESIDDIEDCLFITTNVFVNDDITTISDGFSNTARWFLDAIVEKNTVIKGIEYYTRSKNTCNAIFEFWNIDGEQYEKVFEIENTTSSTGWNVVEVTYRTESEIAISVKTSAKSVVAYNSNGKTKYKTDITSDVINANTLSSINISAVAKVKCRKKMIKTSENVVYVGKGCDFEEIQDAIDSITDDSIINPYTIIVNPKGMPYKRFSMIRNKENLENWSAYHWNDNKVRYISIIGIDKEHAVVKETRGEYEMPCAEPLTNGTIANIIFEITHETPLTTPKQGGYAVHIDADTLNHIGYKMIFENCDFISHQAPSVGIGLHENTDLIFNRCNFLSDGDSSYQPNPSYINVSGYGGVFCHSDTKANVLNQNISFDSCRCETVRGSSLNLNKAGSYTSGMKVKALYSTFNRVGASGGKVNREDGIELDYRSYGNNSDVLNA